MRFLHTSDWHLGKYFHEKSLIEDQEFVLNQIIDVLESGKKNDAPYSALIISGDIYDRSIPTVEACSLLNNFLVDVTKKIPELQIFIISGNHDSASRLSFAAPFLERHNIHIVTDTKKIKEPIIIENGEEKVAVYQLPFLTPLSITKEESLEIPCRTQQELYEAACKQILDGHKKNYGDMPSVLNAHLYSIGSSIGNSERSNIGTVEQVDVSLFKDFTYCAFGHIHKTQACDKEGKCYYSGSLLPYNFDDSPETFLLDVEILNSKKINVSKIQLKPLHKIANITAKIEDLIGVFADKKLIDENRNNYVHVKITNEVMPLETFSTLKSSVFPYLLLVSHVQQEAAKKSSSIKERKEAISSRDPAKIFNQFLKDIYEDRTDDKTVEMEKEIFLREASTIDF